MSTLEAAMVDQIRLAVGTNGEVIGIGIDYERWRDSADLRTARFFLRPSEQAHVTDVRSLLRLWTVKEALFKATPDNGGTALVDYELADPASPSGWATGPRGERLRYVGIEADQGQMTLAVCFARGEQ